MGLNIWVLVVFAVVASGYVWRDARRAAASDSGDWEETPPNPFVWALITLLVAPIALPAYAARGKRPVALMASIALALAAIGGALLAPETHHLESPFSGGKAVPWSKFPPGLPQAVRKATEALPVDLATRVVDLLPGLVDFGRSYPGGATLDVKPGTGEARIIATVAIPGHRVLTAVRIFAAPHAAAAALESDAKELHATARDVARRHVLFAAATRDGTSDQLKVEVLERIAPDVIVHTLVVEGGTPKAKVSGPEGPRGDAVEHLALDVAGGVYKVLHVDAAAPPP